MSLIKDIIDRQRNFFSSHSTKDISFRRDQLNKLERTIRKYERNIVKALYNDLGKSEYEAYLTELGIVYHELRYMKKNLKRLASPKKIGSPITNFPSRSYEYSDPYGVVLIMSPWNYPFQLAILPLIGSIAAGNCSIVKPSAYSKETSEILSKILDEFSDEYIAVVKGGRDENQQLLDEKFDYIFFTGSPTVGKIVMEKASKYLTPVTLELGGKSPCIIDETADVDLSARRIVWGKLLNSGQTCIAPDYILVHKGIKEEFKKSIKKYIKEFFGEKPEENPEYPKIINEKHFERLLGLIEASEKVEGGTVNSKERKIAPVIIDNVDWDSPVMSEELFGPIVPIIEFEEIDDIIEEMNKRPKPLALYLFTKSKNNEEKVLNRVSFGGGCINDTIMHIANNKLPFGGVGNSGMGSYHGEKSFDTFSHTKGIVKKGLWLDIKLRYAPYEGKLNMLRKLLK